jgi:hypothetical protein
MVGEPAPTSTMYIVIYGWVGAGLSDCRLLAMIVGKTRPYSFRDFVGAGSTNNI